MNKTKRITGQIMVIVLLLLSVLSIIALTITLATIRDSQEQVQNKKYQEYYSLGERMILDVQKAIGNSTIATGAPLQFNSDATGTLLKSENCVNGGAVALVYCDFKQVPTSEATTSGGLATYDVHVEIADSTTITGQTVGQDQDILLDLGAGNNTVDLSWPQNNIDWNISFDYLDAANNFVTRKLVYTAGSPTVVGPYADVVNAAGDDNCFKIYQNPAGNINSLRIETTVATCTPALVTPLYLRFKPVGGIASVNLSRVAQTAPLQRTIRTVTTSSNSVNDNVQNPTSVLETKYLLTKSPLSLFDYVLRTEQGITKN
jgi:hypothetical protein